MHLRTLALSFALALYGCGGDRADDGARAFRLGVIPGAQDFIVYVMESRGLFEKYDLRPDKIEMLSPANLHLMLGEGEIDVGFGGFTTMAIARARGKNVIAIHGIFSPVNLVLVPHDSPLQLLSDLRGKKLGIFGGPSSTTFTFLSVIAKRWFDLNLAEDVELVTAPGPALVGLLDRGDVDAALVGTTESLKFQAKNTYRVLLDLSDEYRRRQGRAPAHVTITTNEDFASGHGDVLRDFLRAYREAVTYAKENPEIWQEYGRRIEMETEEEVELLRTKMSTNLVSAWDDAQIETQMEYLTLALEVLADSGVTAPPEGLIRDDFNP